MSAGTASESVLPAACISRARSVTKAENARRSVSGVSPEGHGVAQVVAVEVLVVEVDAVVAVIDRERDDGPHVRRAEGRIRRSSGGRGRRRAPSRRRSSAGASSWPRRRSCAPSPERRGSRDRVGRCPAGGSRWRSASPRATRQGGWRRARPRARRTSRRPPRRAPDPRSPRRATRRSDDSPGGAAACTGATQDRLSAPSAMAHEGRGSLMARIIRGLPPGERSHLPGGAGR